MENLMYVVPVVSVLALLFAGYLAVKVAKQEEGTEKMKRSHLRSVRVHAHSLLQNTRF